MVPERLFVPQSTLEAWLDRADVRIEGQRVWLGGSVPFRLEAAVRFTAAIPEGPSRLLGGAMYETRVTELGGELLGDSVLFQDVGFSVENGYIATREELAP